MKSIRHLFLVLCSGFVWILAVVVSVMLIGVVAVLIGNVFFATPRDEPYRAGHPELSRLS